MRRHLFRYGLALLALGCGAGSPAGGGTGGVPGSGGAAAGTGGLSGSGSGGDAAGSGGAAGTGGAPGAGGTGGAVDAGSDAPMDGGRDASPCPAGVAVCEDFEKYAPGATDLTPDWLTYTYGGGTIKVDASKAFKGSKSLHMTTPAGGRKYADIVKQNPRDQPLLPNRHYGRAMVWLTATPATVHWNINHAAGPLASDPNVFAKYAQGGQVGVLEPGYLTRAWVGDGLTPLRGGGPQDDDPNTPAVDCALAARTQTVPLKKWVCWEWMFDASANALQLWIDTVQQTEIDVANRAVGGCVSGGPRIWQGPRAFTKMVIGWEQYTSPSEVPQEAWIDDLMVGDKRIGCPLPP
ncbi:MAG TPA: hypothetical protein VNO55_19570 [Polyangia bacterium]|nr:hypothetical protein [Polyangia bacterium]